MVEFEKLVSRSIVVMLSKELDLAGVKMSIEKFLRIAIIGGLAILIIVSYALFLIFRQHVALAAIAGLVGMALYEVGLYAILEFRIGSRKTFVESILPDYLQITAANVRSGISLDKAMLLAARPEFKYFSDDVKLVNKELYGGETLQNALTLLSEKYRSMQLKHTIRMILEALQYGGGMTDLLNQVAKDTRNQQMVQKEISGQLFMYTIFIAFAALVGAPVMYALTSQMMGVTNSVWSGILQQNPGGLPTAGLSFLRPSPPKITTQQYHIFALTAILLITGFGSFIVSAIASGSIVGGLKYLPVFLLVGFAVFFLTSMAISGIFSTISGV